MTQQDIKNKYEKINEIEPDYIKVAELIVLQSQCYPHPNRKYVMPNHKKSNWDYCPDCGWNK